MFCTWLFVRYRTILPLITSVLFFSSCANQPRLEVALGDAQSACVVLLHGLNRSWRSMEEIANVLNQSGYTTVNVDYPSRQGTIESLVALSVDIGVAQCRSRNARRIDFVTHSIGGIVLRYAQSQMPIPGLNRVVMLGPPNHGSEVVDIGRGWPGAIYVGGKAGLELGTDANSIPAKLGSVNFEVGVIAGDTTDNPWMSAMLPERDDGKVTVQSTIVAGMKDFLIVDDSHRSMLTDPDVIANIKAFLDDGVFLRSNMNLLEAGRLYNKDSAKAR